jgi:hypothetical protein
MLILSVRFVVDVMLCALRSYSMSINRLFLLSTQPVVLHEIREV